MLVVQGALIPPQADVHWAAQRSFGWWQFVNGIISTAALLPPKELSIADPSRQANGDPPRGCGQRRGEDEISADANGADAPRCSSAQGAVQQCTQLQRWLRWAESGRTFAKRISNARELIIGR